MDMLNDLANSEFLKVPPDKMTLCPVNFEKLLNAYSVMLIISMIWIKFTQVNPFLI